MQTKRVIGIVLAVVSAVFLALACLWSMFLMFVFMEGQGSDEEAVMILQPLTCLCMMPCGLALLIGIVLAVMSPNTPATDE